jgi:hypothetical protein
MDVVTHVSRAVCLDPWCEPVASGVVPSRATCRVGAAAARAPTAPLSATAHARRSLFQLHSRAAPAASFKSRYRRCLGTDIELVVQLLAPRHLR